MQVTLDVKDLLSKIQNLNPGVDLRELKSWLFDLVVDLPEPPRPVRTAQQRPTASVDKPSPTNSQQNAVETVEEKSAENPELLQELPAAIFSDASPPPPRQQTKVGGPQVIVSGARKAAAEERQSKRQEIRKLTEMSGKEIAQMATNQLLSKKEKTGNQFVTEGNDGGPPVSGSDIEIG